MEGARWTIRLPLFTAGFTLRVCNRNRLHQHPTQHGPKMAQDDPRWPKILTSHSPFEPPVADSAKQLEKQLASALPLSDSLPSLPSLTTRLCFLCHVTAARRLASSMSTLCDRCCPENVNSSLRRLDCCRSCSVNFRSTSSATRTLWNRKE